MNNQIEIIEIVPHRYNSKIINIWFKLDNKVRYLSIFDKSIIKNKSNEQIIEIVKAIEKQNELFNK